MKKLLNWRFWVLVALLSTSGILFFMEPDGNSENYYTIFFITKALSITCFLLYIKLTKYFVKQDKI